MMVAVTASPPVDSGRSVRMTFAPTSLMQKVFRAADWRGSSGRSAAPDLRIPKMAATRSGVRSRSTATTVPGPAPAGTNLDAVTAARRQTPRHPAAGTAPRLHQPRCDDRRSVIQLPIGQGRVADLHG